MRIIKSFFLILTLLIFTSGTSVFAENATRDECVAKVQGAVKIAVEQGKDAALQAVGDKAGGFVWKDSYVFGTTADEAVTVAHPIKPGLVGKNLLHVKDVNGVLLFAEIAKVASSDAGKGWVDYMWPKPGEKKPSPKHTYVERVPNMNLAFGAGYYE
jgi:cytochrome c